MRKVEQKIESCSQQDVELHVERVGTFTAVLNGHFLADRHVNIEKIIQLLLKPQMSPTHINKNTRGCIFCLPAYAVRTHPDNEASIIHVIQAGTKEVFSVAH